MSLAALLDCSPRPQRKQALAVWHINPGPIIRYILGSTWNYFRSSRSTKILNLSIVIFWLTLAYHSPVLDFIYVGLLTSSVSARCLFSYNTCVVIYLAYYWPFSTTSLLFLLFPCFTIIKNIACCWHDSQGSRSLL